MGKYWRGKDDAGDREEGNGTEEEEEEEKEEEEEEEERRGLARFYGAKEGQRRIYDFRGRLIEMISENDEDNNSRNSRKIQREKNAAPLDRYIST